MQDSEEPDLTFVAPPDAHAYEFQSSAVVEMLEKLATKFKDEQLALEKKEMEDHHTYQMLTMDLRNSIAAAEHEISKKKEWSAKHMQTHAETQALLTQVSATRAADFSYLTELDTTCNAKAVGFDARQKLRAEEIVAIERAIAILQQDSVAGATSKHLPGSLLAKATALVQIERNSQPENDIQERAATFLKGVSERIDSHVLSILASKVQLSPFTKVKQLIGDLIARLKAQELEEQQHKQWCDTELGTNLQTRTTKSDEVDGFHIEIDTLSTRISVLTKEVAILSKEIALIAAEMAKAASLRAAEKITNEDTIADAVAAQMELNRAITVLQDFYGTAANAVALTSSKFKVSKQPEIFEAPYTASDNAKNKNNVVAFLEVILSDFARLEAETSATENQAALDHTATAGQALLDKGAKEKLVKAKNIEKTSKSGDLVTARHNLELAQSQLDAALAYYDKLKPSCLTTSTEASSEGRIQRRNAEIQALKEALSILSGETIPDSAPDALYSSVDGGNFASDVSIPTLAPAVGAVTATR